MLGPWLLLTMSQTPIVIVKGAWLLFTKSQTPIVTVLGAWLIIIYYVTNTDCHCERGVVII